MNLAWNNLIWNNELSRLCSSNNTSKTVHPPTYMFAKHSTATDFVDDDEGEYSLGVSGTRWEPYCRMWVFSNCCQCSQYRCTLWGLPHTACARLLWPLDPMPMVVNSDGSLSPGLYKQRNKYSKLANIEGHTNFAALYNLRSPSKLTVAVCHGERIKASSCWKLGLQSQAMDTTDTLNLTRPSCSFPSLSKAVPLQIGSWCGIVHASSSLDIPWPTHQCWTMSIS